MATQTYTLPNIPIPLVRNLLLLLSLLLLRLLLLLPQFFNVDRRDLRLIGQPNGEFKVEVREHVLRGYSTAAIWLFGRLISDLHAGINSSIHRILEFRHLHHWCHIILHFERGTLATVVAIVARIRFGIANVGSGGTGSCRGGGCVEWTVSLRINSTAVKLSFDVSIPIVLDLVISSSG